MAKTTRPRTTGQGTKRAAPTTPVTAPPDSEKPTTPPAAPTGADAPQADAPSSTAPSAATPTSGTGPSSRSIPAPETGKPDASDTDPTPATLGAASRPAGPSLAKPASAAPRPAPSGGPAPTRPEAAATAARPAPPARRTGVVPLVLGGFVAAILGFFAAWLGLAQQTDPAVTARLDALSAEIAALPAPAEATDLAPLTQAQTDLDAGLAALSAETTARLDGIAATLTDLDTRLTTVERAPSEDGSVTQTAITSFERELQGLRDELAAQEVRFQTMADEAAATLADAQSAAAATEAEATAAADAAALRAATARLRAALDTGAALTGPLADLESAGIAVPEALAEPADTGVPTLAALQSDFPDVSRAALAATRAAEDSAGMGSLFSSMLQVRSVEPRAGDDPDAVLSRAEAAVRENRLADALTELDTLPEVATEALAPWRAAATARLDAIAAVDTLDPSVTQ